MAEAYARKWLPRTEEHEPVEAPVKDVEIADRHRLVLFAQAAGEMQELRAVRACEPLARKPQHEALEVTAEAQQHPLPRQARSVRSGFLDAPAH